MLAVQAYDTRQGVKLDLPTIGHSDTERPIFFAIFTVVDMVNIINRRHYSRLNFVHVLV